ncbi:unnamed protein product, partial [Hapterophycus canaliculatus]
VDAFAVVLKEAHHGDPWFSSTKELQLASLDLCVACRAVTTLHLRVDEDIPERLLDAPDTIDTHALARTPINHRSTRVPRLRPLGVVWDCFSVGERLGHAIPAVADVELWKFGE